MAISTSRITYRRGVPNNYPGFFFAAQANNTIPYPLNKYLRGYSFINRTNWNRSNPRNLWPWSK
jgi:hypothetical protein